MDGEKTFCGLSYSNSWSSVMTACWCGSVFSEHGPSSDVNAHYQEWSRKHADCKEQPREARKVFWLSFCDPERAEGSQFLGACMVDVTGEEAEAAAIEVMLRFPFAQEGAEWITAATRKAHSLGCNPGGEIATAEVPLNNHMLKHYQLGVLMDRATVERIDAEIAAAQV